MKTVPELLFLCCVVSCINSGLSGICKSDGKYDVLQQMEGQDYLCGNHKPTYGLQGYLDNLQDFQLLLL